MVTIINSTRKTKLITLNFLIVVFSTISLISFISSFIKLSKDTLKILDKAIKLLTSGQLLFVSQFEMVCLETNILKASSS